MPGRSRSVPLADWPLTLRLLVKAAELECPRGHAEALVDLTTLALRKVPARGIFDPGARDEHELFTAIESVAKAHLNFGEARTAWRSALEAARLPLERRDDLETAARLRSHVRLHSTRRVMTVCGSARKRQVH